MRTGMMNDSIQKWQKKDQRKTFWEVVRFEAMTMFLLSLIAAVLVYSVMGFLGLL